MTYALCKKLIANGKYDKNELINKLDVFLLAGRITEQEYKELTALVNSEQDIKKQE